MTAGAESQDGRGTARPWQALRRLSNRTSLQTKLIATLIMLVTVALVVISCVGASILRGYLLGQTDNSLRASAIEQIAAQAVTDSLDGNGCLRSGFELANAGNPVWWIPDGGSIQQIVAPPADGMSNSCMGNGGPTTAAVSAVAPRLVANPQTTTTISGPVAGDRWRLISYNEPVSNGTTGIMIVGVDVSNVYGTI